MKRKNIWIVSLLALGLALAAAALFWLLPAQERQQAQQRAAQSDARTHDFAAVRAYASPYVGNNSNTVNLFYHLPLGDVPARFEIEDDASLCVRYQAALAELDAAKVRRDLVYDSAAAFALIDNLSAVRYAFSDGSYTFTRAQMEAVLGVPLSGLRDGAAMHDQVQAQLEDTEFVASFYVLTQSRPVQAQPVD